MSSSTGSGLPSGETNVLVTWDDLDDGGRIGACARAGRSTWSSSPTTLSRPDVRVNVGAVTA